jgi:predicted GNAT superfamily acetyltransferase
MTSYLKTEAYRNPDLLRLAKDSPCSLCGSYGTTVSAHSNYIEHGKSMGRKADDSYIAFLCYKCHSDIDQGGSSYDDKKQKWYLAMSKTYHYLLTNGYLLVDKRANQGKEIF